MRVATGLEEATGEVLTRAATDRSSAPNKGGDDGSRSSTLLHSPVREKKELFERIFRRDFPGEDALENEGRHVERGDLVKARHRWIEEEHHRKRKKWNKKHSGVYRIAAFHQVETRDTEDERSMFLSSPRPMSGTSFEGGTTGLPPDPVEEEHRQSCSSASARRRLDKLGAAEQREHPDETRQQQSMSTHAVILASKSASPVQELKSFFEEKLITPPSRTSSTRTGNSRHSARSKGGTQPDAINKLDEEDEPIISAVVEKTATLSLAVTQTRSGSKGSRTEYGKKDPTLFPVSSAPIPEISFNDGPMDVSDLVTDDQGEDISIVRQKKKSLSSGGRRKKNDDSSRRLETVNSSGACSRSKTVSPSGTVTVPVLGASETKRLDAPEVAVEEEQRQKQLKRSQVPTSPTEKMAATVQEAAAGARTAVEACIETALSPSASNSNANEDEWKIVRVDSNPVGTAAACDTRCLGACGIM